MKLAACLLAAAAVMAVPVAAVAQSGPLPGGHAPAVWRTCVPQATHRSGVYLVDNDLFTGAPGRSCIEATDGHSFCVLTNYRPGQGVVGFPDVRTGIFYGSRDRGSGFPYQVRKVPDLVVHAGISDCGNGTPPGTWLGEIHMWFYSGDQIRGHGRVELVAVLRDHGWQPYCTNSFRISRPRMMLIGRPVVVRIGHARAVASIGYCGNRHETGGAGHSWPLIVIHLLRQRSHLGLHLQPLFRQLRRLRWLGPDKWLGNVAVGAECASGCKGLAGSMTVTR